MATAKKAAPKKAAAPKKTAPKKKTQTVPKSQYDNLNLILDKQREENDNLYKRLTLAEQLLKDGIESTKPCPKCQILSILEKLTEGQINAVLRDVNLEIKFSREARKNQLSDRFGEVEREWAQFEADVKSEKAYHETH